MDKNVLRNKLITIKPFNDKKPYIFVSYCHSDYEIVWHDVIELKKRGLNIWIDCENVDGWISYGQEDWNKKVKPRLKGAKGVIVYFSHNSFSAHGFSEECKFLESTQETSKFFRFFIGFDSACCSSVRNKQMELMISNVKRFNNETNGGLDCRKNAYRYITQCENEENYYIDCKDDQSHLSNHDFINSIKLFSSNKEDLSKEEKRQIIDKIKTILSRHTFNDEKWTEAITSQNFLVDLAFTLDIADGDSFEKLINTFLQSFSPQFKGGYKLNEKNVLIIPDENQQLIKCMLDEDERDSYFSNGRLAAKNIIDPEQIYKNYLYGIMISIATAANDNALNNVLRYCIEELLNKSSMDNAGGWIHYRLPWITARILLGIHNVLKNRYILTTLSGSQVVYMQEQANKALASLVDRIYINNQGGCYWRSGAGNWVSDYEATGLCLECFLTFIDMKNNIDPTNRIDKVVDYLFSEEKIYTWLPHDDETIDFSYNDKNTNELLAKVVLSSVLYRMVGVEEWKRYAYKRGEIGRFLEKSINAIYHSDDNIKVRQYCTIQQVLLYVAKAFKEDVR